MSVCVGMIGSLRTSGNEGIPLRVNFKIKKNVTVKLKINNKVKT